MAVGGRMVRWWVAGRHDATAGAARAVDKGAVEVEGRRRWREAVMEMVFARLQLPVAGGE